MPWALMIPRVTAITVMANTELATSVSVRDCPGGRAVWLGEAAPAEAGPLSRMGRIRLKRSCRLFVQ